MAIRTNPYVPSFNSTAARITEPWVGAWVWASGSQVWKGNIGTLIPKPMNMPPKMSHWARLEMSPRATSAASSVMLKVCEPVSQ